MAPSGTPGGHRVPAPYPAKDLQIRIGSLVGAQVTTIPGPPLGLAEAPVQWSADGQFLYVFTAGGGGSLSRVDRLEIATGRRELWKKLMPADPTGVDVMFADFHISRDGQSYAYHYLRVVMSNLIMVEGIK